MRRAAAALALFAVTAWADEVAPPAVLRASGARFVFGQIGLARADQYMLDTATGRLWRLVCSDKDGTGACKAVALQLVPYLDGEGLPFSTPPPTKKP